MRRGAVARRNEGKEANEGRHTLPETLIEEKICHISTSSTLANLGVVHWSTGVAFHCSY